MPICKKCSKSFPNARWIDGKRQILSSRKYCLECSPYKKHNTRPIDDNITNDRVCKNCKKQYKYDRSKGHEKIYVVPVRVRKED